MAFLSNFICLNQMIKRFENCTMFMPLARSDCWRLTFCYCYLIHNKEWYLISGLNMDGLSITGLHLRISISKTTEGPILISKLTKPLSSRPRHSRSEDFYIFLKTPNFNFLFPDEHKLSSSYNNLILQFEDDRWAGHVETWTCKMSSCVLDIEDTQQKQTPHILILSN